MPIVARVLGSLLSAIAGVLVAGATLMVLSHRYPDGLFVGVLAGAFAVPGFLLNAYARDARRQLQAEQLIRTQPRFSIEEVAAVLHKPPEHAHAFIAQQIAAHQLDLAYLQDARGYARRSALPPPPPPPPPGVAPVSVGPCASCGSTSPASESGFCPTCGARAERGRSPQVRA